MNEHQEEHVIPAVEPGVSLGRIEELATGIGNATADEQQALAQAVLRLMAHADNAATRVAAQATTAAGILGLSLPLHAAWTPGSIALFQGLMKSIAEEEAHERRADAQADMVGTIGTMLAALGPAIAAGQGLQERTAPEAPKMGPRKIEV